MEVSGALLQRFPCLSGGSASRRRSITDFPGNLRTLGFQPRKTCGIMCNEFFYKGHLSYYSEPTRCGVNMEKVMVTEKNKTATKKRMKLLKRLSKNLTMFSSMGFGLDPDSGLVGEVQNKTISEAAEVLVKQLEHLKAEQKKLKKKRKQEKAKAKASKMMNAIMEFESSSSSSSESSDSDCCGEVVDMTCFRNKTEPFVKSLQPAVQQTEAAVAVLTSTADAGAPSLEEGCCTRTTGNGEGLQPAVAVLPLMASPPASEDCLSSCRTLETKVAAVKAEPCLRRVEVCMGGKCKKSGGAALLGEFERVMMGVEGSVAACKCMGKCRDGPNIRILNQSDGLSDSIRTPSNAICIGVGLQDVEAIVSSFLGEEP